MRSRVKTYLVVWLLACCCFCYGQQPPVKGKDTLAYPWAGGLNACQLGSIDLDLDGKKDLMVFDRNGNRFMGFVNRGETGELRYEYDAQYAALFPACTDWVVFTDYDGDGLTDLFAYSKGWAGIMVYRNVSTDSLAFDLVKYPYLTSWQGEGEVNLFATNADYPVILDLDGDGDLDILTFGVLGTFIEKHLNLSMERYGTRDSLCFERTDYCWGRVAESESDNLMYLDTCLFGRSMVVNEDGFRHRGATMALRDLNGDGLLDLLVGDVDYPGLTFLQNGGDPNKALMVSQTQHFPPSDPVRLFSMPQPFFIDVNNDGADDLVVSPFDPNPMSTEGNSSVWLYLNEGTDDAPEYRLYSKSFLQDQMLDVGTGAYPVFIDADGDDLIDLLVGDIGDIDSTYYVFGALQTRRTAQIALYRNVGSNQNPAFQLVDEDYAKLSQMIQMGLVPTFGDLDYDGRKEMLVGTAAGNLLLFDADHHLLDGDYLHYDATWSAPCLFDVDEDGVLDLAVGNAEGRLTFYRGRRNGNRTEFTLVSDAWGGVDVCDHDYSYFGYSVPTLFDYDDETMLAVGSERGKLFLFRGITELPDAIFEDVTEQWNAIAPAFVNGFGMRCAVALNDLNGDGRLDIAVGNFSGGLRLFNVEAGVNHGVTEPVSTEVALYPNPASDVVNLLNDVHEIEEVRVCDLYGRILLQRQPYSKHYQINVTKWPSGIYFIIVRDGAGHIESLKFVKE